jgi:hypothetical protein
MMLYEISTNWDETAYQALLEAAERRGGYCVLVRRPNASPICLAWLEQQTGNLESSTETMRWPGTLVYDDSDRVTLLKYRVTPELIAALRRAAKSPFEWLGPDMPEDLAFLRTDGRPWFISIAHERDAFFKVLADEFGQLRDQLGGLELVPQGEDQAPDERF